MDLAQLCLANLFEAPRRGREERRRPPSDVYALLTADRGGIGPRECIIGGQEQEVRAEWEGETSMVGIFHPKN